MTHGNAESVFLIAHVCNSVGKYNTCLIIYWRGLAYQPYFYHKVVKWEWEMMADEVMRTFTPALLTH